MLTYRYNEMIFAALSLGLGLFAATIPNAAQNSVTAIDILLEPDAAMLKHAAASNARLLAVFPKGFALDATHSPAHYTASAFRSHC